jgi:uncharacterized protein YbaR (Trm112 family)
MANEGAAGVPADLLEILVCPVDRAKVHPDGEWLVCEGCGRAYPVRDGIPIMLEEEAEMRKAAGGNGIGDTQ